MATLEIPINGQFSSQVFNIVLEGTQYRFRVYFSFRQSTWLCDLATDRDVDVFTGIKLVPSVDLFARHQSINKPPGALIVSDTAGQGTPPGRDDFGTGRRVLLTYEESAL